VGDRATQPGLERITVSARRSEVGPIRRVPCSCPLEWTCATVLDVLSAEGRRPRPRIADAPPWPSRPPRRRSVDRLRRRRSAPEHPRAQAGGADPYLKLVPVGDDTTDRRRGPRTSAPVRLLLAHRRRDRTLATAAATARRPRRGSRRIRGSCGCSPATPSRSISASAAATPS
jgi:hypothetical protein